MLRERERDRKNVKKNVRSTRKIFKEREREMSMRERGGNEGGDERKSVKIDGDSKKEINRWKSLKEMKEYLRSEFEKETKTWQRERVMKEVMRGKVRRLMEIRRRKQKGGRV